MSSLETRHVSEEDLLKYADGELGSRAMRQVRSHLAACWQCRSELEDLERTAAECARYRKTIREDCLFPSPPAPWRDIRTELRELDATLGSRSVFVRAGEAVRGWFNHPWPWVPAVAGALVLLAAVLYQFRVAPPPQAGELLDQAMSAEQRRPAAPHRLRVHTAAFEVTRKAGAGWEESASEHAQAGQVAGWFRAARYDFDDPLRVASFVHWRATLASRRDRVQVVSSERAPAESYYEIETGTDQGELRDATLRMRRADLEPVAGRFAFQNRQQVDIEQEPAGDDLSGLPGPPETGAPALSPGPGGSPSTSVRLATPGEELEVYAALHRLGADLGEPVEVTREETRIRVNGVGLSAEQREELRQALAPLPDVALSFGDDGATPSAAVPPARSATATPPAPNADVAALQARVEKQLGGRRDFERLSDDALETGDALMARAHALRRLADRFPPPVEAGLSPENRATLASLRREHAAALAEAARHLEQQTMPTLAALGASPVPPSGSLARGWQAATQQLFAQAREMETLLAVMLGGAASDIPADQLPARLAASLAGLRRSAEEYRTLAAE